MAQKIIIVGPAYPLRGGLATFNERMARQFIAQGDEVVLYTFSLQYPSFLFPGKTQLSEDKPPKGLNIKVAINSVNPLNWWKVGKEIAQQKPDIVIIRYWLPFMAPCLGTIARIVKKNKYSKVICLVDNLIPHEKRLGDKQLTRYFVRPIDAFVTMSQTVLQDTLAVTHKKAVLIEHPLIDNFGNPIDKVQARKYLGLEEKQPYILFFGFIRKYKGLDLLYEAIHLLKKAQYAPMPKLIVAGEYYANKENYENLVKELEIADCLVLKTDFISNEEVKYYIGAADFIIQPYREATQSGVTPLAYHFEKPMLVTNVGGLPDIVPDGKVGVVTEPTPIAIAQGIRQLYALDESMLIENVKNEKKKYTWDTFIQVFKDLAK